MKDLLASVAAAPPNSREDRSTAQTTSAGSPRDVRSGGSPVTASETNPVSSSRPDAARHGASAHDRERTAERRRRAGPAGARRSGRQSVL
ncbi:hypothetical protein [Nitrospira moscoviensis]|uniref:hypothetical protein n=1 Tax=Nitrospira moscoviensis TaxID=42253 RepID=UPI0006A7C59A|nr:hypothetical protein [Nitrospira moscoviensis]